ncbi:MAG: hypothetical protein WBA93_03410 [Microcoleaceae cyanobacterium]
MLGKVETIAPQEQPHYLFARLNIYLPLALNFDSFPIAHFQP